MRFRRPAAGLSVLLMATVLLSGCSDDEPKTAPTLTPSPTPSAAVPADVRLSALARTGQDASYTATYALRGRKPASKGTVTVRRTPNAYRLDVTTGGATAILVRNGTGTYSCQKEPKRKTRCFKVAKAGEPIPRLFDAGLQRVFDDYLELFAKYGRAYKVRGVRGIAQHDAVPAASCFNVRNGDVRKSRRVAKGTYCLSPAGIPVRTEFESGRLDMQSLRAGPKDRVTPPAKATPLPG